MSTPGPAAPASAGPQTDDERVREAEAAEVRARVRRGWLVTAVVAGVLVVVVAVVGALGGFRSRTDLLTRVAVGSVIATGPYEVTISKASVERHTSSDEWEVLASGTARTTGATSIEPPTGSSGFVFARGVDRVEVQPSYSVGLGDPTVIEHVDSLTPGLPPVPWTVTFRFRGDPGDEVLVAVFGQEYTTPYLFGDEQGWRPTRQASTMTLPLERLPDQEY